EVEVEKKFFVFKLPYYPLNILDIFTELFEEISLIYAVRPSHKVIKSFASRPYKKDTLWLKRQIKKLPVSLRQKHLAKTNIQELTQDFIQHCEYLRDDWDAKHPEMPFYRLEVERFSTDSNYVEEGLKALGLEVQPEYIQKMLGFVNSKRLLQIPSDKLNVKPSKLSSSSQFKLAKLLSNFLKLIRGVKSHGSN
ncbi:MAG: hypothetical protein AAGF26_14610, partial [Cyanobacteria bacterium P01_G01_bin.49]